MTVYWVVFIVLAWLLGMAVASDPRLNDRILGRLPMRVSTRLFLGTAALVLICVAGLRWGVGADFFAYVRNYETYKISFLEDLRTFDEPGVKGLAFLVSQIWDDPAVFMFAASAITIGLMLWTITKYSIAVAMSYFLFVMVGSWHGSFNGVRQFLACAVVFAGHRFIMNRKLVRYAAVVALASSFHISALAMIALYFVPTNRLRRSHILLFMAGAFGALYAADAVLEVVAFVKGDLTVTEYLVREINPLRIAVAVAPMLLYWTRGVRTEQDGEWFYRNIAVVHAVVMLASSWSAYLGRFGLYTLAFLPLVIPRLIDFPDRRLTILARVGVVLLYGIYWYVDVYGSSALNDYKFNFDSRGAG